LTNRIVTLLRRWWTARGYGVRFHGMSRTTLPPEIRFGGKPRAMRFPDDPLFVADFANVVLDDDYGLRQLASPPRTIVDIGSNIGLFSAYARGLFPQATIHAYEPSPGTAELNRFNAGDPKTTLFVEGVSASGGRARMLELGASTLSRTQTSADGEIVLTSFAQVIERMGAPIDLLKIDCEGAEWDFMVDPALFARVGAIRMEYHLVDGRTLDDLHAMAAGIGFQVVHLNENQGFGIAWLDRR
jgi:FkbM family methyltransferase